MIRIRSSKKNSDEDNCYDLPQVRVCNSMCLFDCESGNKIINY